MNKEDFDYTEWQRELWNDKSIEDVYRLAAEREKARDSESEKS